MRELTLWLALGVWGLLPGLCLVRAARMGWSLPEALAAAPGLSLALVAVSAYVSQLFRLPVSPFGVLPTVVGILGVIVFVSRRPRKEPPADALRSDDGAGWVPWAAFTAPVLVFVILAPMRNIPVIPPTLHDGLDHASYFRLILETRSLDRMTLMAPPFYANGLPLLYPWGFHAWAALVAGTTALPPMHVFSAALVFVSCAIPLSVYVFSARFLGRGWLAVAASWMTLIVWELPFELWRWGGYALLAGAVAVLPVARVCLAGLTNYAALSAAAILAVGVLTVHPSQAMTLLLFVASSSAILVSARELPKRVVWIPLVAVALVALVSSVGPRLWAPLAEFAFRAAQQAELVKGQIVWAWPEGVYGRFIRSSDGRAWMFALAFLGAFQALRDTRARVLVGLHLLSSLMILCAPYRTWLTLLFYHEPERIWYLQYACLPGLAALGLDRCVRLAEARLAGVDTILAQRRVLWPAFLAVCMSLFSARHYEIGREHLTKYARDELSFTDKRVVRDFEWIETHVPAGEALFNAPGDMGLALPFTGHRFVFWSGGIAISPKTHWYAALKSLNDPEARFPEGLDVLAEHGIRYVFVTTIVANRGRLDATKLETNPAFEKLYASETAAIFRVRRYWIRQIGIADSDHVKLEGFLPVERTGSEPFRRTNGTGRVHVRELGARGSSCLFRVSGPSSDYRVALDGTELERRGLGFALPPGKLGQPQLELEIRSLPLGVTVSAMSVFCLLE